MTYVLLQLGVNLFVKATIILGGAGLIVRCMRRSSAATRHLVWSFSLTALVVLPILEFALPEWSIELSRPADRAAVELAPINAAPIEDINGASPARTPSEVAVTPNTISAATIGAGIGLVLWVVGALLLFSRLALHIAAARRIARRAEPAHDEVQCHAHNVARRPIRIVISNDIPVPGSTGLFRPRILLPESARHWSRDHLDVVLRHEAAHIARYDYAVYLIVETCKALYWPNPLVRIAAKRCEIERERACDDVALASGVRSQSYATRLLEMARAQFVVAGTLGMARRSGLAERIRSILNGSTNRSPVGGARFAMVGALAALVIVPVATYQVVQERPPTVEELLVELKSEDIVTGRRAAWWLGEREDPAAVDALIDRLHDGHPDVRIVVAWALGEIKSPSAIVALTEALDSGDPLLREMATLALGEIEHPDAIQPIVEAFDTHQELVTAAIWALGEIPTEDAQMAQHEAAKKIEGASVEHEDVWTGSFDDIGHVRDGLPELVVQLEHSESARERRQAAWNLGMLGEVEAVNPLLDALRDPDPSVRAMVVWALDEINPTP